MSAVLLRPYDDRSDDEFPAEDLWTYKKIGDKGTAMTGYPNVSTFHDFKYHPKEVTTGGFDTWAYDQRGVFSWTIEFWSPIRQAGIEKYKFIDWYRDHPLEDDLKLMKWNDDVLKGKGFLPWKPFNHPQLGRVEIGGWDWLHMWTNPPLKFLEKEIAPFPGWIVWHALISPRLDSPQRGGLPRRQGHLPRAAGGAEHRLAADLCDQEGAGQEIHARRGGRDRAAARWDAAIGQAARGAGSTRGARLPFRVRG